MKTGKVETENIAVDVFAGKIGGFIGNKLQHIKANGNEMKVVDNFIDRQQRKVNNLKQINSSRTQARQNVLDEVQSAKNKILNGTNLKASVTSSGAISSTLNPIVDADDKKENNAK